MTLGLVGRKVGMTTLLYKLPLVRKKLIVSTKLKLVTLRKQVLKPVAVWLNLL